MPRTQGVLVLIERPHQWTPRSEWDMPHRAVVVDVVEDRNLDPATFLRHYNAVSLDEAGTTWAALCRRTPKVGVEVALLGHSPGSTRTSASRLG
jgi:hypothetical protein